MKRLKRPPIKTVAKKAPAKTITRRGPSTEPVKKRKVAPTKGIEPRADVPKGVASEEDLKLREAHKHQLLDNIVAEERVAKHHQSIADDARQELKQLLIEDEDTHFSSASGKATIVESSSAVIDQKKLQKSIGSLLWNKVTTRILDKGKLEAFMKSGEISPETVAQCTDLKERTPSLRVTPK
jgi:hypothetical protein